MASTIPLQSSRRRRTPAPHPDLSAEHRTLHLLDLENLLGGVVTPGRCRRVWDEYVETVRVSGSDQVVLAVSLRNAVASAFSLPAGIRRVIGENNKDGADRALADAIDVLHVAARFGRVVIGSGDHFFTSMAIELRRAGCQVAQVLGAAQYVAADLYCACPTNYVLPIHRDREAS